MANSETPREELLRYAVRILEEERRHYNWVGIYLLEGDTLVLTTTSASLPSIPASRWA
jgi:putative methionine-R-sulfoxide reductase with GAF domain